MASVPVTPSQGELEASWKELLGQRHRLGSDPRLAELAIAIVRELGNGKSHREVLCEIADAWSAHWRLALPAASLLIQQATARGMDEPVISEDTPAHHAARALRRALESLEPSEREDPNIAGNLQASLGNALRMCGVGEDEAARRAFEDAIALDPGRGSWWYDSGLLHKWRGRFRDGFAANQAALDRGAPPRPALWNLAICATALGEGDAAVEAWRALEVPAERDSTTGMPWMADLPPRLVRVLSRRSPVDGTTELVEGVGFELLWVAPISPCHGVVQSPAFRDAPIDYGDLVLWDGAPVAEHTPPRAEPVPVFPLLEILHRGDEHRWPFVALEREPGAVSSIEAELPHGARVFVQHERIAHHCSDCEAGIPHEHDEGTTSPHARGFVRGKIVLAADADLNAVRTAWESIVGRRLTAALPGLYESLEDTKRAGQEHQAWRGIERKALRQKADR